MSSSSITLSADFEKRYPPQPGGAIIQAAFTQPADRFSVAILFGPSGCGKTTILRCLAGLERPERGSIRFGEQIWSDAATNSFLPPQQRDIGYLFQDYALFPHLSVAGNIAYGLHEMPRQARVERVGQTLELLQLSGLQHRYPHQISGGEQQRVALARTVVRKPRLLLLDEPLSALDAPTREHLRRELRQLLSRLAIPCWVVTHDRLEAVSLGDDVIVMDHGSVLQAGPLAQVFSQPRDQRVAELVGVETVVPARITSIEGGLAMLEVKPVGERAATVRAAGTLNPNRPAGAPVHLLAMAPHGSIGDVLICIRGEDVTLRKDASPHSSARNRLPATIVSLSSEGPVVRINLDCGFPLVAIVTRPAMDELNLRPGDAVTAHIKAPAIHVMTRTLRD